MSSQKYFQHTIPAGYFLSPPAARKVQIGAGQAETLSGIADHANPKKSAYQVS